MAVCLVAAVAVAAEPTDIGGPLLAPTHAVADRADTTCADSALASGATANSDSADATREAGPPVPVAVGTALPDTLSPRGALLRSGILPGWGQLRNGKPVKAVLFAGAAGGFLVASIGDVRALRRADTTEQKEVRAARRNTRFLYFFIATTLSALDAFVDAHLADFGDEPVTPGAGTPLLQVTWTLAF